MHRTGFALGRKQTINNIEPGKIEIILDQTGDVLTVDEDDIEKVRSAQKKMPYRIFIRYSIFRQTLHNLIE